MYYFTKTNKYGLEVVADVTSDVTFARTSGINFVETDQSPRIGDYLHEGSFIGVDSDDYSIIAAIIATKEAERTADEGITIPEPQPEGEVNPDPDPDEQVIPELEVPAIPEGSNGEIPEDGEMHFDDSIIDDEVTRLREAYDWTTELLSRASSASVDSDNPRRIVFDPPVSIPGVEETLSEVIISDDEEDLDGYINTITLANQKAKRAYDAAVARAAEIASSE